MEMTLFQDIVRRLRDEGVEELGLFYIGESFMVPWLPYAIKFAKKECGFPYVFLTTNGRLAVPTRVQACMEAGLDSLKFSLNHADAEQYSQVCGLPQFNFETIMGNVKGARVVRDGVLKKTGHRCGLYASSIQYDGEQGNRMKKILAECVIPYVDENYYLPLYNQGAQVTSDLTERGLHATAGNPGRVGAMRDPLPCWALFSEAHVTYDGKLSLCCFTGDDRWNAGDLTKQTVMEAWHSPLAQELRAAHLKKDVRGTVCENCVG